jgi:hypothetical protein
MKKRACRERQQVNVAGQNVLAKITRPNNKAFSGNFAEQFCMDEMNLSEIGL